MNWNRLIAPVFLLACWNLLASCSESQENMGAGPAEGQVAEQANPGASDFPAPVCRATLPANVSPVFIDTDLHVGNASPPSPHLQNLQVMHVKGPIMPGNTYELTPLSSSPAHTWPEGVKLVAEASPVKNEYCIDTVVTPHDGGPSRAHRFAFKVLSNDPATFCVERPTGQCRRLEPEESQHIATLHGGSADLL